MQTSIAILDVQGLNKKVKTCVAWVFNLIKLEEILNKYNFYEKFKY
jgi:hypothetical protein